MKFKRAIWILGYDESGKNVKWDCDRGFSEIERSTKSGDLCVEVGNKLFLVIEEVEVSDRFDSSEVSGGTFTKGKKLENVSVLNGGSTIRKKNVAEVISETYAGEVKTRNGDLKFVGEVETRNCNLKKVAGEVKTRNGDLKFGGIDWPWISDLKLTGIEWPQTCK